MAFVRGNISDKNITHWMPLPAAPKTAKGIKVEKLLAHQDAVEMLEDAFADPQSADATTIHPYYLRSVLLRILEVVDPAQ
jgi:hypothetical protein